jgi:hypothetical protein
MKSHIASIAVALAIVAGRSAGEHLLVTAEQSD